MAVSSKVITEKGRPYIDVLDKEPIAVDSTGYNEWRKKNNDAEDIIIVCVAESHLQYI